MPQRLPQTVSQNVPSVLATLCFYAFKTAFWHLETLLRPRSAFDVLFYSCVLPEEKKHFPKKILMAVNALGMPGETLLRRLSLSVKANGCRELPLDCQFRSPVGIEVSEPLSVGFLRWLTLLAFVWYGTSHTCPVCSSIFCVFSLFRLSQFAEVTMIYFCT